MKPTRNKITGKILFSLFVLLLSQNFAYGQWVQQTSGVSAGLADVQFINPNTGWMCGINGTIIKTTNAGQNWLIQNSGVTETLNDIHAIDLNVVYCVGIFETILKTTNGGNNWIIIRGNVNPGKFFYGLNFININTGWICGSGQWVLRTTNGGNTFDSSFVAPSFYDIYFKDNMNGLIAGETGSLYKSTNGGINWIQINVLNEAAEFFKLTFIGDTGWIAGWQNRKIYKTTNFGSTWDSLTRVTPSPDIWNATSLFFSSLNTGWICGGAGNIWRTSNGGYNWFKQVTPSNLGYGGIYFVNDSVGWSLGNSGLIVHTTTSGQIVGISSSQNETQNAYLMSQNFPNPFNPVTKIKYQILNNNTNVKITVLEISGKEIQTLIDKKQNSGNYEVLFNGSNLSSGVYFYTLKTEDVVITKKMILIK